MVEYTASMAGFAVVITIITLGFFGLMGAAICSFVVIRIAKRRFSHDRQLYRTVRMPLALAPFAAIVWVALSFVLHVHISNDLAHQDCGLGLSPDPFVTLPNGYKLGSHNTYDGYILAPGFSTDGPVAGPGYVRSIVTLLIRGDEARGTQFDFKASKTRPFLFNMKTREFHTDSPSRSDHHCDSSNPACVDVWSLANTQAQSGADSYWVLYQENRHRWPESVFLLLVLLGEGTIGWYVLRLLRRSNTSTPTQVSGEL